MPRGDRTGPMGAGPRTGRGMGYCAGYGVPGFMNRPGLWGWFTGWLPGRGRGGGRGFRNWFFATGLTGWQRAALGWPAWGGAVPPTAPFSSQDELNILRQQAQTLSETLKDLEQRIKDLEAHEQAPEA